MKKTNYMNKYDIEEKVKKSKLTGKELENYKQDLIDEMNYNLKQDKQYTYDRSSNYPLGFIH